MAVHAAGFRHLLLNEFAERACQTLRANKASAETARGIHSAAV